MTTKIKVKGQKVVYEGRFFSVKNINFEGSNGEPGIWEAVERKTFGKIVAICAITKDDELILEKSFRIPIMSDVIELPAGLMDKKGESPKRAVKRELLEETGYRVKKVELILDGPFNAGLSNCEMQIFFAQNAEKVQEPELENGEEIEVIKVPVKKLFEFLKRKRKNCKIDIKTFSLIPFLQKKGIL